jgi:hypothetical protein
MRTLSVFVQCEKVNNHPGMDKSAQNEFYGLFPLGCYSAHIYKEKAELTAIKERESKWLIK